MAVALALALLPALARAEGTVCGFETVIVPDGRVIESVIPNGATFWFLVDVSGGRSYSVEVKSKIAQWGTLPAISIFGLPNTCPPTALAGATNTIGTDPKIPTTAFRRSFTTAASTDFHRISVNNTTGADLAYSLTVSDTTLFSTAWSTNGSFDSFYSLYNTTNSTCNGTLTLFNTSGGAVTTAAVTIAPGATTSTNTVTLGTVRNTTGTAKFTHNCPPGAILAEAAIANFSISPTPYFQFVHFESTREAAH